MRNLRSRIGAGLGLLAAVLVVPFAATLPTASAQDTVIVDNGHVDAIAPRIIDSRLHVQYKDGSRPDAPVWREPGTVVTHLKPESRIQVPEDPNFAFLGNPGDDLWHIPQDQIEGIVWAGWNTESLDASQVDPNSVRWTLDAITGDERDSTPPGIMTIFQNGSFGTPLMVFHTKQPLPQTYDLALGTHAHANWMFNAQGVYRLTFTVTATSVTGQRLTDTETYTFAVGDVDPATVEPGKGTDPPTTTTSISPPADDCVVLDDGHVDAIAPRLLDGRLTTQVKDGTAGPDKVVWRKPDAVVLHVVPEARNTIPNDPNYAFLGAAGNPVWIIPQTQIPGIVWAGWNTEELSAATVSGDVTLGLSKVDGPGNVAVFLAGQSPMVVFNAADGLPDTLRIPLGTHAHANWGFGAEGIYRLTFTVTATLASGETQTDTDTYTFAVGDVDPSAALGGRCGGGGPTSTSSTTSTTQPGPTTSSDSDGVPGPQGDTQPLAKTGVGGLRYLVPVGALLLVGGVALLILFRRRSKESA